MAEVMVIILEFWSVVRLHLNELEKEIVSSEPLVSLIT